MKIRVVLTEDNNYLAVSLREKLELFEDIEVKFRASNGKDLLEQLSEDSAIDVILMDIEMPLMDGLEATAKVKNTYPGIKVIILTVFDDEDKIFQAVQAGAIGYLLKDETPEKIYEAINIVMNGGAFMSPVIAAKSMQLLRSRDKVIPSGDETDFALSQRETDVLELISHGLNYNEIGEKLFISPFTVRKHIENIYRKLQVNNKVQAVQKAIKHRIIE